MTTIKFATPEVCKDTLIDAVEGGINYWAKVNHYKPDAGTCQIVDLETKRTFNLTPDVIYTGFENALQNGFMFADITALDAIEADAVVQYAIFGELIYG